MNKSLITVLIIFCFSCRGHKESKDYPIDQSKFFIESLPYRVEGEFNTYKFRIKHYHNETLSKVELTVDGIDGDDKLIESGKAVENNMLKGEERIFYIKLRGVEIIEINWRISDYESK